MDPHLRVFANIESLQADFPGFVIWGETIRSRFAYVAQALDGDTNPRVVTSSSLDRLRARLEEPVAASDPAKPNVARMRRAYTAARLHHHSRAAVEGFFAGLDLLPPGLTDARAWPGPPGPPGTIEPNETVREATVICGVGRKAGRGR